jgi:hypothetical protein
LAPIVALTLAGPAAAAEASPAPVDASTAPECPTGWYCADEGDGMAEPPLPPAPPTSRYPISSLVGRVGWVPFPQEASERALLFGGGLAFRHRPGRVASYEAGLLAFGGRDYVGRSRYELGCELNLVLLGGRQPDPGPFVLVGPHLSFARVEELQPTLIFLGAQMGFGAAWPLGRGGQRLLTEFDVFARGRVDSEARNSPEYRDPLTGATSNGTTGVMLRLGFESDL